MTSEIKVDTISEQTSANGVTIDGLTIKDGNIIGDVALAGTTPTFTVGDGGAEDAALIFDGNAQDFYMALDDSADDLVIGTGSTIGSNAKMVIENGGNVGIGTSSPANTLHVDASGGGTIKLTRLGSSTDAFLRLECDGTNGGIVSHADINLDVGGGDISLKGSGTEYGKFNLSGNSLNIHSSISDGDIVFKGNDGGSAITALTLDMSAAGYATFNSGATFGGNVLLADIIASGSGGIALQTDEGTKRIIVEDDGDVIINETSTSSDFRVESNGNTHMLFVDGGNDHVNIGTSSDLGATFNVKAPDNNTTQQLVLTDNDNQTKTHIGNFSNTTYITNNTHYNGSSWVKDDNAVGTSFIGAGDGSVNFGTSTDATPTVRMTIDSTGAVTMPTQPAFCANPSTTQSNISNNVTLVFGTERFDQNGDFASNTFTAPVTGRYQLQYSLRFEGVDTNADFFRVNMVTSNNTYELLLDPGAYGTTPNYQDFAMGVLADMDANDTAFLRFDYGGISDPSSFDLRVASFFSGYLVC